LLSLRRCCSDYRHVVLLTYVVSTTEEVPLGETMLFIPFLIRLSTVLFDFMHFFKKNITENTWLLLICSIDLAVEHNESPCLSCNKVKQ
jgi:hypothetical protein